MELDEVRIAVIGLGYVGLPWRWRSATSTRPWVLILTDNVSPP